MPIQFEIDPARRHVEAKAEGLVSLADIEAFLDAIVVQGAIPYRKLFDARLAFGKYDDNDVMLLGARISAYAANFEPRGALALIVASQEHSDLGRRFINLGKSGRPAEIFLSEAKAREWLAAQPEA